jgi:translation initiation factor 4E
MAAVENGHPVTDENAVPAVSASTDEVTVFHDPENFNVKHPLMHEWTLWFTKPPSGKVTRDPISTNKHRASHR